MGERWHRSGARPRPPAQGEGRTKSSPELRPNRVVITGRSTSTRAVTDRGQRLRRLYTERDLLAAECLRADVWKRLDAPGLAACVSTLVHEPRHEQADPSPRMPTEDVAVAVTEMQRLWSQLDDLEEEHGLERIQPLTNKPRTQGGAITLAALEVAEFVDAKYLCIFTESGDTARRIRICAHCGWLFVDKSRNSSRLWCDMAVCGNRRKAQRHYLRRRAVYREVVDV